MGRPLTPLELRESEREQLQSMAHSRSLPHRSVRRTEIVLLVAKKLAQWSGRWGGGRVSNFGLEHQRFLDRGFNDLHDELRHGVPRSITDDQVTEVVYKTLKPKPKEQTQWSVWGVKNIV